MAAKIKEYQDIILNWAKIRKHERKLINYCQKKHLSQVVPYKNNPKVLKHKIDEVVRWYDEFTGMDEVRIAQKRVLEDEENFRKAQEERRKILNELNEVQNKIKELYAELDTTNRGEDRYVHLVTLEHKLLKEEKAILNKFSTAEKNERDFFAALSSSVKLSHEKERAQSERTKYWSIIGSVLGTVIGILGTSINNHFKMNELKQLIKNSSDKELLKHLHSYFETNEEMYNKFQSNEKDMKYNTSRVEESISKLLTRLNSVEDSLKKLEETNKSNIQIVTDSEKAYSVMVPIESLTETVTREYNHTKILLYTLTVLSVLVPLFVKYN